MELGGKMSYYKCTPEMHKVCTNSAICHLCDGIRLFKDPKAEAKAKREARAQKILDRKRAPLKTYSKEKKDGMAFEKNVQKKWNRKFANVQAARSDPKLRSKDMGRGSTRGSLGEAQRQPNSGATWRAKGDIKLEHALMECKERGTVTSKGEKQITIMKNWLDKMVIEAHQEARNYWYLPFGFNGDDDIYLIKPYDHEMELIYELRVARERIQELETQLGGDTHAID